MAARAKRGFRRKTVARKARRYARKRVVHRPLSRHPCAPYTMTRVVYSQLIDPDPAVGALAIYLFSANSLFDPNVTGVGHQPMGFDNWMGFYGRYVVLGARITATYFQGAANYAPLICGIYTDNNNTSTSIVSAMIEQSGSRYKYLSGSASGIGKVTVTKTWSAKRALGVSSKLLTDAGIYSGTDSASPTIQNYFHVFVGPADAATDLPVIPIQIRVEYIAKFYDRITMSQS